MPCTLQEWLQEIFCKYADWTKFAETGWTVVPKAECEWTSLSFSLDILCNSDVVGT